MYKCEVHGITRFNIYYRCNISCSSIVKNIHVVIASDCSIVNSILYLYLLKRKILLTFLFNICVC